MHESQKLVFRRSDYKNVEEFYNTIFQQFRILIESNNVFSFHENPQERGIFVVQFGPSTITETSSYPVWLTADEIIEMTALSRFAKYQEAQKFVEDYESNNPDDDWDLPNIPTKKDKGGNFDA